MTNEELMAENISLKKQIALLLQEITEIEQNVMKGYDAIYNLNRKNIELTQQIKKQEETPHPIKK